MLNIIHQNKCKQLEYQKHNKEEQKSEKENVTCKIIAVQQSMLTFTPQGNKDLLFFIENHYLPFNL